MSRFFEYIGPKEGTEGPLSAVADGVAVLRGGYTRRNQDDPGVDSMLLEKQEGVLLNAVSPGTMFSQVVTLPDDTPVAPMELTADGGFQGPIKIRVDEFPDA